ncbi:Aldo/keto reductase family-domain-containing protein [Podospora fimiseda]|uniref:Aldo/keto reductase family-domain-containing protein n=1 Tax=Podospora fimiseda TaxID=252190 RepID=A0AAN7BI73_9PEZI|nr:Aldo/keto reductase family-domain-containing protein [Podospora fimiseda]
MSNQTHRPPISAVLPPLLLGTATFNTQYVSDPHSMPYRDIVARAISLDVTGFDTSPYYGPSELLLGEALNALFTSSTSPLARDKIFLVTKAGRIAGDEFDYSPSWIRYSILRSLKRLHTPYLDLVYMHDVEFISPKKVLTAVQELRRLRDQEGVIKYVGISGFPADVLASLAEMILAETGEPLDAVLSYGHFTLQNRKLALSWVTENPSPEIISNSPLTRLKAAGVSAVLNASMLGMGLLTQRGIPADNDPSSPLAKWHPSPPALRLACKSLSEITTSKQSERLESIAIRWALQEYARVGAAAGLGVDVGDGKQVGATVCGVSSIPELEETVKEWNDVLAGLDSPTPRGQKVLDLVKNELWPALGSWIDYAWDSPGEGYVNTRKPEDKGQVPDDGIIAKFEESRKSGKQ